MPNHKIILTCLSAFTLCACAPFSPNDQHAGICNQLNSQMIFNGGTSNTRTADIERAEQPMLRQSYDANNCYVSKSKKTA